jgi:hypothetical protein
MPRVIRLAKELSCRDLSRHTPPGEIVHHAQFAHLIELRAPWKHKLVRFAQ